MKKTLTLIVVLILLIAGTIAVLLSRSSDAPPAPEFSGIDLPGGGSVDQGSGFTPTDKNLPVATVGGGSALVRDIRTDADTKNLGSGNYLFAEAGSINTAQVYQIVYFSLDSSIIISLLSEPLSEARTQAESALLADLGVSASEACTLRISVGTPYTVSYGLSGKNLGLSFCPGSTVLP